MKQRTKLSKTAKNLLVLSCALVCVVALGLVDYFTGTEIRSAVFYVVPIAATAWLTSRRYVAVVVAASVLTWGVAEYFDHTSLPGWTLLWNEFAALVIYTLIAGLVSGFKRERDRVQALLERESRYARTDLLTGLANSREFRDRLQGELARARRDNQPLCLLYLDLDHFKQVNDRYGHTAGDQTLHEIANGVRANLRATDLAARIGGDEFAVMLWRTGPEEAAEVGERLRQFVASVAAKYPDSGLGVSVGVVWFEAPPAAVDELIARADAAMYEAKTHRNRVHLLRVGREPAAQNAPENAATEAHA